MANLLRAFVVALLALVISACSSGGKNPLTGPDPIVSVPPPVVTPPAPTAVLVGQMVFSLSPCPDVCGGGVGKTLPTTPKGELVIKTTLAEKMEATLEVILFSDSQPRVEIAKRLIQTAPDASDPVIGSKGEVAFSHDGSPCFVVIRNKTPTTLNGGAQILSLPEVR